MSIMFTCPHCAHVTNVADQYAGQSGPCANCGQTITIPLGESPLLAKPTMPTSYPAAPAGKSNAWLFVAIALAVMCLCGGGMLVALLLPAVQSAREAARRMQCSNNLKQIALALHNYHDVHRCFPAAYLTDKDGKPLHSWRVALLPYLEQQQLYEQYNFNEPWDSPNNLAVAQRMPDVFRCPSDPTNGTPGSNLSNYVVVVGDPAQQPLQTMFVPNHWTRMSEITDGTSNTLMVVETASPVPWTQPDADPRMDQWLAQFAAGPKGSPSSHPGGANVAMGDGSVRFLSQSIDQQQLRLLLQPSDGQAVSLPY
jgi:prepilin-type processing-associated H-X9-DG protein